jgi:hypothetical protein
MGRATHLGFESTGLAHPRMGPRLHGHSGRRAASWRQD